MVASATTEKKRRPQPRSADNPDNEAGAGTNNKKLEELTPEELLELVQAMQSMLIFLTKVQMDQLSENRKLKEKLEYEIERHHRKELDVANLRGKIEAYQDLLRGVHIMSGRIEVTRADEVVFGDRSSF